MSKLPSWAAELDAAYARLEKLIEFLLDHAYNVPKDWRKRMDQIDDAIAKQKGEIVLANRADARADALAEIDAACALALREAAEHEPLILEGGVGGWVQLRCSKCGIFKEANWSEHILSLRPDLDKALAEHDRKVRLEEAKLWADKAVDKKLSQGLFVAALLGHRLWIWMQERIAALETPAPEEK